MTLISPGVEVKEIDLTTVIPSAATTDGASVGQFAWGPALERVLVGSEDDLVKNFHEPVYPQSFATPLPAAYAVDFLISASFLAYARRLYQVRAISATAVNANTSVSAGAFVAVTASQIRNATHYDSLAGTLTTAFLIGKYPGILGNSIGVSAALTAASFGSTSALAGTWTFTRNVDPTTIPSYTNTNNYTTVPTLTVSTGDQTANFNVGDYVTFVSSGVTYKNRVAAIAGTGNVTLVLEKFGLQAPAVTTATVVTTVKMVWRFATAFSAAPGTNEIHLVLFDATGAWTGTVGTVLESYRNLNMTNTAATYEDGTASYYKTVLNNGSRFVWAGDQTVTLSGSKAASGQLGNGLDGSALTDAEYIAGWELFTNPDLIDISLVIGGVSGTGSTTSQSDATAAVKQNYLIDNIAESRKDCIVFVSPKQADVVNAGGNELANVVAFRNQLPSTSFGFLDSGWKYMFDRYNNTYRWVPLCGDMAGLTARTENERDAWFPPAGFNRGSVKNVVKLAWNPSQAQRDDLYKVNINPVVDFDGTGTILFGDKTLLAKSSAFDRINVRRLFIILEKAISRASRFSLFELNDEFTRQRFVSLVEPFLREIQGRRGITDFLVVCDETNNTAQVIDTNRFIGDIYIKPARSINFITLNFVAVPTGVEFSEVVGQF